MNTLTQELVAALVRLLVLLEREISRRASVAAAAHNDEQLAVWTVLEHHVIAARDEAQLRRLLDEAQERFLQNADEISRSQLDDLRHLFSHGGAATEEFAELLWAGLVFQVDEAREMLWANYAEAARATILNTSQPLPTNWGEMVMTAEILMGTVFDVIDAQWGTFSYVIRAFPIMEIIQEAISPGYAKDHRDEYGELGDYLCAVVEAHSTIQFNGANAAVEDVYIPRKLVPFEDLFPSQSLARFRVGDRSFKPLSPAHVVFPFYPSEVAAEGVQLAAVMSKHPVWILAGPQGGGKSIILKHLVVAYSQLEAQNSPPAHVPIYVDLANYLSTGQDEITLQEYVLNKLPQMLGLDATVAAALREEIEAGRCLFLIDHFDTAITAEQRRMLGARVRSAVGEWRQLGNQAVIATQHFANLMLDAPCYVPRPLERGQIRALTLRWGVAFSRAQQATLDDMRAHRAATSDTNAVLRQIVGNPPLALLASVPENVLTMVSIHAPRFTLPVQRVELFRLVTDQMVSAVLSTLYAINLESVGPAVLQPTARDVEAILATVAEFVADMRPGGMLAEVEVRRIVKRYLTAEYKQLSDTELQTVAEQLVVALRTSGSILIEKRPGWLGFAFRTLQDYYLGRSLLMEFHLAADRIKQRMENPAWYGAIYFAVGLAALRSTEDAVWLVESAVLNSGQSRLSKVTDRYLMPGVFLAASLIASGVALKQDLVTRVAAALIDVWLDGGPSSPGRFRLIYELAWHHLAALSTRVEGRAVSPLILEALEQGDLYRQLFALDLLRLWEMADEAIEQRVVDLVQQSASHEFKRTLVNTLAAREHIPDSGVNILVGFCQDLDDTVARMAQQVLLRVDDLPSLSIWAEYIVSESPAQQRIGMHALKQIGSLSPDATRRLIGVLHSGDEAYARRAFDVLMSALNLGESELETALGIADTRREVVTAVPIRSLHRTPNTSQRVLNIALAWATSGQLELRQVALDILLHTESNSTELIDTLLDLTNSEEAEFRAKAISGLVKKAAGDRRATAVVIPHIGDRSAAVRAAAARALTQLDIERDDLEMGLQVLLNDNDEEVVQAALQAASTLDELGPGLEGAVVGCVSVGQRPTRQQAINCLTQRTTLSIPAMLALVYALPDFWQSHGEVIRDCVVRFTPLADDVIRALMLMALPNEDTYYPPEVRIHAIEILARTSDSVLVFNMLQQMAEGRLTEDESTRQAALLALAHTTQFAKEARQIFNRFSGNSHTSVDLRCAAAVANVRLLAQLSTPLQPGDAEQAGFALFHLLEDTRPKAAWSREAALQDRLLEALHQTILQAWYSPPQLTV